MSLLVHARTSCFEAFCFHHEACATRNSPIATSNSATLWNLPQLCKMLIRDVGTLGFGVEGLIVQVHMVPLSIFQPIASRDDDTCCPGVSYTAPDGCNTCNLDASLSLSLKT